MRAIVIHAGSISFRDLEPSSRIEIDTASREQPQAGDFSNALGVFVCVEEGDAHDDVAILADRVRNIDGSRSYDVLVLFPFGHLSPVPWSPQAPDAIKRVLTELYKRVATQLPRVELTTFGYHKTLSLRGWTFDSDTPGKPLIETRPISSPVTEAVILQSESPDDRFSLVFAWGAPSMADALGIEIGHFMTSPSLKRSARVALTSICGEDDLLKRLAAHIHAAGVEVS